MQWATSEWWDFNVFAPLGGYFSGLEFTWLTADFWISKWEPFTIWWSEQRKEGGILYWTTGEWWTKTVWDPLTKFFKELAPDWLTADFWWTKFKGILDALQSIAAKAISYISSILNAFSSGTDKSKNFFGQPGGPNTPLPPSALPPALPPGRVGFMANGGIITRPQLAVVGERGPEAIIPLSRGGIGTTINIYVSGNNVVGEGAADELGNIVADRVLRRMRTISPFSVR